MYKREKGERKKMTKGRKGIGLLRVVGERAEELKRKGDGVGRKG